MICEETAPEPERALNKSETGISDEERDKLIENKNQVDLGSEASTVRGQA